MRAFLPNLLALVTGAPRYLPKIEWSSNSWTHNFFRGYEIVFGRRAGVRLEAKTSAVEGQIIREFYTMEAGVAYAESCIRSLFTLPKFAPFRVYIPMLSSPFGNIPASPYLFAIAFDATTAGNGGTSAATSYTLAHTCTGSDLTLTWGGTVQTNTSFSVSATYNSVSMTEKVVDYSIGGGGTGLKTYLYYLASPATGANNLVVSNGSNAWFTVGVMSFSGTDTSSPTGVSGGNHGSSTTASQALTTDTANSVIVDCLLNDNSVSDDSSTTGSNQTKKYNNTGPTNLGRRIFGSMMTTTTAGSYTPAWSWSGSSAFGMVAMEVHEKATAVANGNFFAFM